MMMMNTAAHPQHMNDVVKDLECVLSGWEKHCMLVWGLNQCTIASFLIKVSITSIFESLEQ